MIINLRSLNVVFVDDQGQTRRLIVSGWAGKPPNQWPLSVGVYKPDEKGVHWTHERDATKEEKEKVIEEITRLFERTR